MSREAGRACKRVSVDLVVDFGPDTPHELATSALLQSVPAGTPEAHAALTAVCLHAVSKTKFVAEVAVRILAAARSGWRCSRCFASVASRPTDAAATRAARQDSSGLLRTLAKPRRLKILSLLADGELSARDL